MGSAPRVSIKGKNGKLELHEGFVRIDRRTPLGFLFHGFAGQKDIPLDKIASVEIKKPGFAVGYIEFSLVGGNEKHRGGPAWGENIVTFNKKANYELALAVRDAVQSRHGPSTSSHSPSVADEIEKMHSLVQKGLISREDFERQKKKLLA